MEHFYKSFKGALATILTQKKYMFWKLVNSFKIMMTTVMFHLSQTVYPGI
jgi:hypothetical protein